MSEWNRVSTEICDSTSYQQFRKSLLSFMKSIGSTLFYSSSFGVKLLVSLRLGFSNLHEYKFRNNFPNALKPLRSCSLEPETTSPYLSRCHTFFSACSALMNYPNLISPTIFQNETALSNILLHGHSKKST